MTDDTSGIHLNYGHETPRWQRIWTRVSAFFHEHFDETWKSVGYLAGMAAHYAGGRTQLILALGFAFLAGGLGLAIERDAHTAGPFWMWIGGLFIGLVIPVRPGDKSK